ncbi:hypothetical protein CaCOL14_003001 [Colletotrichum acutatum]
MSFLYPRQDTLKGCFASPFGSRSNKAAETTTMAKPTRYQARPEFYGAFSTVDDVKGKAKQLSAEATAEFEKASAKAQSAAGGKIELYSGKYYAACTVGGLMACGLTHTAVTPLDLVKVRRQIDSKLYRGNFQAWGMIFRKEGLRGIMTGWGPTFWGYSAQGACKYGFYEYFKKVRKSPSMLNLSSQSVERSFVTNTRLSRPTPTSRAPTMPKSTRRSSSSPPRPPPSSSPTSPSAPLRLSRSACRAAFRLPTRAPSTASARSRPRKDGEASTRACTRSGAGRSPTP